MLVDFIIKLVNRGISKYLGCETLVAGQWYEVKSNIEEKWNNVDGDFTIGPKVSVLYKGELVKAVSGDKIRHEGFKIFSTLDYGNFWKMQEIDPPEEEIPGRNHQYIVGGTKEGKLYVNKKDVMKDPEWQQQLDKIRRFSRNQGL